MATDAAADEAAALFAEPKGPSTHPEDVGAHSDVSSRSPSPETAAAGLTYGGRGRIDASSYYSIDAANTGPKGVMADARAYERAWHARQKSKPSTTSGGRWPFSRGEKSRKKRGGSDSKSGDSTPDRESDGDEEFMQQWRNARLTELRSTSSQQRTRRLSPSMRRYGRLETVDAVGYLDAIEKSGRDVVVVVSIFDDESDISHHIESQLAQLAKRHTRTRFIRLSHEEAEIDPAGVPAILAYKDADLFANLVSVVDHFPVDGNDAGVEGEGEEAVLERVLRAHHVL